MIVSLHDPAALRGGEKIRGWREDDYPVHGPLGVVALSRCLDVRNWLLATGWEGTDGSSSSFDDLQGVRIGRTGGQFNRLPATCHDAGYELLRRFQPPGRVREALDAEYRDGCIRALRAKLVTGSLSYRVGVLQAWSRYFALRAFGWRAARPR